jgi:hypothetical protein
MGWTGACPRAAPRHGTTTDSRAQEGAIGDSGRGAGSLTHRLPVGRSPAYPQPDDRPGSIATIPAD